jgi:GT2 family glycosyltransferase/SAM-dependent methyltransferase
MGEIFSRERPPLTLGFTGERLTTSVGGQIEIEHYHRYFLARELCRDKDVLDIASGEGYGSAFLAQAARSVVGVELNAEVAAHAARAYSRRNLHFVAGDVRSIPLRDASVDIVVSFETIEHVYQHDAFIAEVRRVLRPNGALIISTPDRDIYSPSNSAANPFHVHELTKEEFTTILRRSFQHVECMLQRPMIGSAMLHEQVADTDNGTTPITFERRGDNHFEVSQGLARAVYAVALASDQAIGLPPATLYIASSDLAAHEAELHGAREQARQGQAQCEQFARELADLRAEHQRQVASNEGLQAEYQREIASSESLRAENAGLERQLTDLQMENQRLAARGEALQTEKVASWRELQGLRAAHQALFSTDQSLRMENAALTERAAQFKDVQSMLIAETHHLWGSSSWRLFRPLRNVSRRLGGHRREFEPSPTSAAEALQTVITIRQSLSWELTAPLRIVHRILSRFRRSGVDDGRSSTSGVSLTALAASEPEALPKPPARSESDYDRWLTKNGLNNNALRKLREASEKFSYTPLISIVTPVYNVAEEWLRKAIESVRVQAYSNWELCLVNDASTEGHIKPILDDYAKSDSRIKVTHLPQNEGIAGATNRGLALASGEFIALLDNDDELSPDALFEVVRELNTDQTVDLFYSDEDKLELDGRRVEPFFKPDWNPDLLLSTNYITHFLTLRKSALQSIGGFRLGLDGSQDHDLVLRFTERTDRIKHIPKILYHWRKIPGSAAYSAKPEAYEAGKRAIREALQRRGYNGSVHNSLLPGLYLVRYELRANPLVSIIIPTRNRYELLDRCIASIERHTNYKNYEIVVLDNDSSEPASLAYFDQLKDRSRVCHFPGPFNFSKINNFGTLQAEGEYLLFLNNDTEVIGPDWLSGMLEHAQRPEVGAVGAKLLYPSGTIQHAGVVMGLGGVAGHAFKHMPGDRPGYFGLTDSIRDCSAVTAACMMTRREVFDELHGFDEDLAVAFNDIDLCLRMRSKGYLIVYTPLALLYHHESASRGNLHPPADERMMADRWRKMLRSGDPYYNPNLTLDREDWSLAT